MNSCTASDFPCKCVAEVLGSFEEDLRFLAATELHPALQRGPASGGSDTFGGGRGSAAGSSSGAGGSVAAGASLSASASIAAGSSSFGSASGAQAQAPRRLIDLVDAATLRELYGSCSKSHRHYAAKVGHGPAQREEAACGWTCLVC